MKRNRVLILAVVVIAFLAIGGYLVSRNVGGGGRAVAIDLTVSGTTITPAHPAVKQGDRVTMTITADKMEEIHLHGYDIPFQVPSAGGSVTHAFTADKSGSFEMEIEASAQHLTFFTVNP
jgi:FtsP/CotA-like multicopper oxidase with cupredoxin domain